MYPSRFEATPVPAPGCRVSRYELASVYRDARALLQAGTSDARAWVHTGTRDDVIDLTGEDDDIEPQLCDQISSLAIAAPFEPFQIRPRERSGQRHTSGTTSPSTQASSSPRRSQSSQSSATTSSRSNKRKESESESGDAGDTRSGSIKRRLRPRGQVNYNEDAAFGEAMDLDEPEPERDMPESIERSANDSNGESDSNASDTEVWEVKRVVAEKRGPRIHEFLLDWVGSDEQNWIAARRCQCRDLIADFRAIPRVPADTHYLANLERNRLRRADNARRTGAARPQNIRPKGPGSYRNPKTGRFEKRRATPQLPLFDVETSDSDTEDEPESEIGSPEPSSWRRQEAHIRTPSNTPSLDHFSASINGSPASMTSDIHPPDLQQDNLEEAEETVVWVRKTPAADDDSSSQPSGDKGKRPIQTAKITWIRDTPGFEDEHSSFAHSEGTLVFTSTKSKTSQTSKIPSLDGAEPMAPVPPKLPHTHLKAFGLPSINSRSSPTVTQQTSRWTAVKSSAIATSSGSPRQASVIPMTKPKVSQIASCNSPLLPAMIDQRCNLPQQNLPAVAQAIITRPGSFSGVSSVSRTPSSSHSASMGHIRIPFRAISTSKSMPPPPPRSSPRADQEPAGLQSDAHLQFAKPVAFTSPLPVAVSSRGGQRVPFTAPREARTLKRPKLKAKKPLVSPRRPANTMAFVSNSYKPSQPASLNWSPPASPVRSTSTKKFSDPAPGFARLPEPAVTPSVDYASKPMPTSDVAVHSVRTEPLIDISDLLELATSITAARRSTSNIPLPRAIPETSIPPEAPHRSCQSMTASAPGKVQQAAESKKFAPKMPGGAGEVRPFPQRKTSYVHHASQGAAKKVLSVHGVTINLGKYSDGSRCNSSTTATPDTMRKSRSPIRREPPNKGTKQRKFVRDRYTQAIEDEIASNTGPHVASKKAIGAILTAASANAYRPAPTVAVPRNIERSPSVATKWFIAARKKEKEEALARAPKGLRSELNRDFGPWYPQGLCEAAKRVEAENFNWECRRLGVNYSRDTPLPSIET
ncbi:hypothetical protein L207DRAFT_180177 [Hyaloscypha variabilis F]|uniref:Chromo domain-containing protein n=1 Tax=Hyaloscypha variabilis (strain UAMH 11265 / GT02V1 / F) TaxID=1149755 RepID=A0A2J6R1A8_HYAVF|nr:hypothetical protein L207DRAFT_180177 [Hyaloscypha variabilis F]